MFTVFKLFTFQIKETLEVLSLLILFLRSVKTLSKAAFSEMLPRHCKYNIYYPSYLD